MHGACTLNHLPTTFRSSLHLLDAKMPTQCNFILLSPKLPPVSSRPLASSVSPAWMLQPPNMTLDVVELFYIQDKNTSWKRQFRYIFLLFRRRDRKTSEYNWLHLKSCSSTNSRHVFLATNWVLVDIFWWVHKISLPSFNVERWANNMR